MVLYLKFGSNLPGCPFHKQGTLIHDKHLVGIRNDILQAVFGEQYSSPNITINLLHGLQKIGGCNGIQLGGWLVQDQ